MVDPFGEINFLTRSENRVRVLETLATDPHAKRDLVAITGISDVTVGRTLEDFADRGWIRETDRGYATTQIGDMLAEDYARLHESMDVAARLGPILDYLPVDAIDFDIRHLTDARISDPEDYDALRIIGRWIELVRESDRIVGTSHAPPTTTIASVVHEEVTSNSLDFEVIFTADTAEEIRNSSPAAEMHAEMVRAGAKIYRAAEGADLPCIVALCDDLATMLGLDESGSPVGGIETRAAPVREWVHETIETHREAATPLSPEYFVQ